jgi:hypothetical protein
VEQVLALSAEYPKLTALEEATRRTTNDEPVWLPFGRDEPWLVRTNSRLGDLPASVVAVRANPIALALGEPGLAGLSTTPPPRARPLGPSLPGLYLLANPRADPVTTGWSLPQQF